MRRLAVHTATVTITACAAVLVLTLPAQAALEPLPTDHELQLEHDFLTPLKELLAGQNPLDDLLRETNSDLPIPVNLA
ncbi:hypothetical protein [Halostreptopolyspora alba]|uniref:Secreted protein n=1 Tax=Halostreptopolyspora alba TaxID=2487137 RepID=A0A3N0E1U4_9ACTN|nr:hypothetical protein EFW17_21275 [Nocardiopsaceae bacterium YIM 96095]